jgi:hypothetical protein
MKPIPLEAVLLICVFAILVAYGKWRWALKGAGWTTKEKRLIAGLIFGIFLSLAAFDAFYNHRFGFPQF